MGSTHSPQIAAGYFCSHCDAEKAVEKLIEAGFERSAIECVKTPENRQAARAESVTEKQEETGGIWNGIVEFLKADAHYDPYSKEHHGTDSYRTAGEPCHGGYAETSTAPPPGGPNLPDTQSAYIAHRLREGQEGAVVSVAAGARLKDAEAVLRTSQGQSGSYPL